MEEAEKLPALKAQKLREWFTTFANGNRAIHLNFKEQ